jgi:8-oxo-dGTP pyrophosphatase MutT (NUDIX family)
MKINGPWKIKESQEKYKNPWMKVREDKVIQPDGKEGICGVVEMLNGACILPLDDDGYVYLIDQFRYTIEKNSIEVAGGSMNKGEKILETAKRELKEEAGIIADEWIFLETIYPTTTAIKSSSSLYLTRKLKFIKATPEGTEQIKVLKVKLEEAVKMVMDNRINHGPSCVLILKASRYLAIK